MNNNLSDNTCINNMQIFSENVAFNEKSDFENRIAYYDRNNHRDDQVLILLREPDEVKGCDSIDAFRGNVCWINDLISGTVTKEYARNASRNRSLTRYRNQFRQYLNSISEKLDKVKLSDIAFANVRPEAGGTIAGEAYWNYEHKSRLDIILGVVKPKYIFACREIINIIQERPGAKVLNNGLEYSNGKKLRCIEWENMFFYEIYHPSYSYASVK